MPTKSIVPREDGEGGLGTSQKRWGEIFVKKASLGTNTTASGENAVAEGRDTTASGQASHAEGEGTTASEPYSHAEGIETTAQGTASHAEGIRSIAYLFTQHAKASGAFPPDDEPGGAQYSNVCVRNITTNDFPTELFINGLDTRITFPDQNRAWNFRIRVIASQSGGISGAVGDTAGWRINGVIKIVNGTVSFVGDPKIEILGLDTGAGNWTVGIIADNTNKALVVKVRGEANKTIRWVGFVELVEVKFA